MFICSYNVILIVVIFLPQTFPWYVNALTEYTAEDINNTAYLIWFVPRVSTSRAKEMLEPLAKAYISKKARENMEVKLMFFIAGEENEASVSIRENARLPRGDPLLAIIDVPRNQVSPIIINPYYSIIMVCTFGSMSAVACGRSQ